MDDLGGDDKLLTQRGGFSLYEVTAVGRTTKQGVHAGFRIDGPAGSTEYCAEPEQAAKRFLELAPIPR